MMNHRRTPLLRDITLEDVADGLKRGNFTSRQLVEVYLARIAEVDDEFHSVLKINEEALSIAAHLDEEQARSGRRGPLHGVPILLKDNMWTLDKMSTSAGSYALLGARRAKEASLVTRLRQAGAVIIGKANMSEWANFRSTDSSDGWSPRGEQTIGAYYPGSSPEGSSSGSCVATALGLTFAAVGTESAIKVMAKAGANIIDNANLSSVAEWDAWNAKGRNIQSEVHFREAIEKHCKTLVENPNNIRTLEDIIKFTKRHPEEDYPSRNTELWLRSATSEDFQENIEKMVRLSGKESILGALDAFNLDVLAVPSAPNPPVTFAARVGLPIITVPLGFYPPGTLIEKNDRGDLVERAPGMPFFGKAFSERTLIRVAYAFEQLTHARHKNQPYRLPKTELRDVIGDLTKS
ncbi:amidase, partial [Lecanoromycetidae sp. Uapishka_2]